MASNTSSPSTASTHSASSQGPAYDEKGLSPSPDEKHQTTVTPYDPESTSTPVISTRATAEGRALDDAYLVAGEVAASLTPEETSALRRKLDRRIPGLLCLVYFSQFLDKTALNYASITGLPIKGQEYNQVAAAFYYGYLAWVFPTQWLAQRCPWGPTVYLGLNIVAWGVVLGCHAAADTMGPFFACRFLLGMLESCVSPILIQTVVAFYPKKEQGSRIAAFYVCNGITQIVGPLIAYGLTFYSGGAFSDGAWRLLYIVLGIAAVLVGLVVLFFLPSSPTSARFLSPHEKRVALERVRGNASGTVQKSTFKWHQAREAAFDLRVWTVLVIMALVSIPNGGLSNFSSKILQNFGYSTRETLLIGLPQGAVSITFTLLCGYLTDRLEERILPVVVATVPTIVGAAILVGLGRNPKDHKGALVFAIYICQSFGSALTVIYAWSASNMAGSSKKVAVNAALMCFFSLGNIAGSYIFQAKDAPDYIPGKVAVLVTLLAALFIVGTLRLLVSRANVLKRQAIEDLKARNGWDDEEIRRRRDAEAFKDLTDRENPFFVYTS